MSVIRENSNRLRACLNVPGISSAGYYRAFPVLVDGLECGRERRFDRVCFLKRSTDSVTFGLAHYCE